jgi:hypothetical protein
MSFDDDTIWRAHLDIYNQKAEPLPITNVTRTRVYTEEWSGTAIHADGTVERIGKRQVLALDRDELQNGRHVRRGRVIYSLDNPDLDSLFNPDADL